MHPDYVGGWSGPWMFMPVIGLICMVAFVYVVFVRGGFRPPWMGPHGRSDGDPGSETALDILKKRYASGEITSDEYERMKRDISD